MYNFKKNNFLIEIAVLVFIIILVGCSYKIDKSNTGEPILGKKMSYKSTKVPTFESFAKIDTTAFYIQVFERRYYNDTEKQNPAVLIFHNDGFFEETLVNGYNKNKQINRNSLHLGKYRINGDILQTEQFVPSRGGKTKYWDRLNRKAQIAHDKIIFDKTNHSSLTVYKKVYSLP